MKLIAHETLVNEGSGARLSFGTKGGGGGWPFWDRYLQLDGEPLMHIGNICNTCVFFFERVGSGAVSSVSVGAIKAQLDHGIGAINPDVLGLRDILPTGSYSVALFEARPKLVHPGEVDDYFTSDLWLSWQDDPSDETVPPSYYRLGDRQLADHEKHFQFAVPLQALEALDRKQVDTYRAQIRSGLRPTAAAVGVLDIKTSSDYPVNCDGQDLHVEFPCHWCLAHYMIDGHHKMAAAAAEGAPITLLSFITVEHSLGDPEVLLNRLGAY